MKFSTLLSFLAGAVAGAATYALCSGGSRHHALSKAPEDLGGVRGLAAAGPDLMPDDGVVSGRPAAAAAEPVGKTTGGDTQQRQPRH